MPVTFGRIHPTRSRRTSYRASRTRSETVTFLDTLNPQEVEGNVTAIGELLITRDHDIAGIRQGVCVGSSRR